MFLIIFKSGLNSEKSKIEFDKPLAFFKANEMLMEAINRYKQTGQSMRISYKIVEMDTGESLFNSKILIDKEISSLYQLIKGNSNTPKIVIDYVTKIENREVIEAEDVVSFNVHVEEQANLEKLKAEKNEILQQLKKDEKERQQRDIEYQKKMKEIQDETKAIEKSMQLKEKEEVVKESQRIEALRLLEEKKAKAMQLMEEKRIRDKEKTEKHEKRLKQVDEDTKKSEIELASIETELEKKELERKKELQILKEKKLEADREVNVLKAEGDNEQVKHEQELIEYKELEEPLSLSNSNANQTSIAMPKMTVKEKLQELDLEDVKGMSVQFVKIAVKESVSGSKKAYRLLRNYHSKRMAEKQEKLENQNKQEEIEKKLTLEKIKFMEELKKDRIQQEKELNREARQKERESMIQHKIEDRYRAVKKRKLGRYPIYNNSSSKFILGTVGIIIVALGSIYYFDLDNTFPILNVVKSYLDDFATMILSVTKRS
ncbi:hypothetical protein [Lederbergia lenta]|uniref:hypothetical protein n=1 Tax=Lederbergia lenta TaxID=1467 RepID=UPI00203E5FBB|nr:hypothetical protein [Lederbergia lenta]MCM3113638.1 hypothetical protein [Lederbergia lenta]